MRFWNNPEFVRHLRAELRTNRTIVVAAVTIAICVLIWIGCWGSRQTDMAMWHRQGLQFGNPTPARMAEMERESPMIVSRSLYWTLMYGQLGVLTFWSLFSCALSISGERERKTWDFQRATCLSPSELLIGKLLGEPVLAYFIVLCCLPIAVLACWAGHAGGRNLLSGYILIFSSALFLGLVGLWLSSLFESRSRGVGLIGTFALYALFGFSVSFSDSSFPGVAAFSPVTALTVMMKPDNQLAPVAGLFGRPVPWVVLSLLLYVSFGAWLVFMILRTLKKDFDQAKPLSRWQAVGCFAFLSFCLYALFFPRPNDTLVGANFASFITFLNGTFLFALGFSVITPHERLRVWWRTRQGLGSLFAENGPPWPWLLMSAAVGYGLLVWGMFVWKNIVGFERQVLLTALMQFATAAVYVTRDILFIQWCKLTRLRAPTVKGFLFVGLYYATAVVCASVFSISSPDLGRRLDSLLTPVGAFDPLVPASAAVFLGMGIQLLAIFVLHFAITARLHRTPATA
jgi:hypothetical protein